MGRNKKQDDRRIVADDWKATGESSRKIAQRTGIPHRSVSRYIQEAKQIVNRQIRTFQDAPVQRRKNQIYIVTSVQNDTDIELDFYLALKRKAVSCGAQLIIAPSWLRPNEASKFNVDESDLVLEDMDLGPRIRLCSSFRVLPTAKNPLTAKRPLGLGGKSMIIPAPQIAFEPIPSLEVGGTKQIMHTTGSISKAKDCYATNANGQRDFNNHSVAAVLIQVYDDYDAVRVLQGDEKGFWDIDGWWSAAEHRPLPGDGIPALILGDVHEHHVDKKCVAATFTDDDSIVNTLRPREIYLHDLYDSGTQNHHKRGHFLQSWADAHFGKDSVLDELEGMAEFLRMVAKPFFKMKVVASNHNDHLFQWLESTNPQTDLKNAEIWCRLTALMMKSARLGKAGPSMGNPLALWMEAEHPDILQFLDFMPRNQPHLVEGIDVSQHGDKGVNGAKGSLNSFAQIPFPTVTGHAHTPGIRWLAWVVGCMCEKRPGYANGLSGWMHAHVAIYPGGALQMIFVHDGKWK